jgi:hypothetical protein
VIDREMTAVEYNSYQELLRLQDVAKAEAEAKAQAKAAAEAKLARIRINYRRPSGFRFIAQFGM